MKIELEDVQPCVKKISVEISVEQVSKEKNALYASLAKDINMPGFRKGKVPRAIIERRMSKEVLGDAAQKLIKTAYQEAIKSNNLRPVGDPMMDDIKIEENEPLSFTATVEVLPDLELADAGKARFTRKIPKVSDKEIDSILENQRERAARIVPVEGRAVEDGDLALMDYSATKDGEDVGLLKGENKLVQIGVGSMLDSVYAGVLGMKKGEEKTFDAVLPKDFPDPELAEATLAFNVKINEIKRKELPAVDDDFAREISEFDTLDELKSDFRKNLEQRNLSMARNDLREEVLTWLIDNNPFDPPPRIVENQVQRMVKEAEEKEAAGKSGPLPSDRKTMIERFRARATRDIKEQTLMGDYGPKEKIEVTDEDIREQMESLSQMLGQSVEQTWNLMSKSGSIDGLRHKVLIDKTYEALMSKMEITDEYIEESNG